MKSVKSYLILISLLLSGCTSTGAFNFVNKLDNQHVIVEGNVDNFEFEEVKTEECAHTRLMHFERLEPTYSKPGHIEFYYCLDCHKSFYTYRCNHEILDTSGSVLDKWDGRYLSPLTRPLSIVPNNIKRYLDAETDEEIISALQDVSAYNDQVENMVSWTGNNGPYTIEVADNNVFVDYKSYTSSTNTFVFDPILKPGQLFYYRIKDGSGNIIHDDLSCMVETDYSLRPLKIDGVNNVRDLGGWETVSGKKIAYGKLFRGAELMNISEKGRKTLVEDLGVKTEIDVRTDHDQEFFDPRVTFHKCGMWQYTQIIPDYQIWSADNSDALSYDEGSPYSIKKVFEILADDSNYPVYYHCTAGADRTGTISYLIEGLLGIPYETLVKDFELTSFSIQGPRYRDAISEDGKSFTGSGVYSNSGNFILFGKLNQLMNTRYGTEDGLLSTAVENYLKTVCGVSEQTIQAVRNNLLTD